MSIYVTEKDNLISIAPVYILSKYGTTEKTKLFIEKKEMNVESVLYWRKKPKLFVHFSSMKKITKYSEENYYSQPSLQSSSNPTTGNTLIPSTSIANAGTAPPITTIGHYKSQSNESLTGIQPYRTLSDDFFNDPAYKDASDQFQKLAFHFTHNQNDFKLIIDFAFTKPKLRRTSPAPAPAPAPAGTNNENAKKEAERIRASRFTSPDEVELSLRDEKSSADEPVPGSDTTSSDNDEDENEEAKARRFHENSFEDFENDNDEDAANVRDQLYSIDELLELFLELHAKSVKIAHLEQQAQSPSSTAGSSSSTGNAQSTTNKAVLDVILKQEQLLQLNNHFKTQEAVIVMNNVLNRFFFKLTSKYFFQWIDRVKVDHDEDMKKDRHRWRLHAAANQELDLQAWYHALFYQEVYRLRGHFWYKDAVLPAYKQSYDLVDNALTPLEEAALAHVLCSPDTSYGDVAGQMFIVQSILPSKLFLLFQQLASQGAQIVKYPRQGRPAKKLFRFSFVDGNIYLTWKGKFGNQGVGMYEVTGISTGIQTEVLKWSGQSSKADQYLSLLCADRSVDLLFDSEEERNNWKEMLTLLMTKEQGVLPGVERIEAASDFDEYILYSSIGKKFRR